MAANVAERHRWAVETLAVEPDDRLLEIGCGHGVALSLICGRLAGGTITAIDRSQTMIDMASRRNQEHVASGKAVFQTAALDRADFGNERFNKIFAARVGLFLKEPARELAIISELLTPKGALHLFYEPPAADKTTEIADKLTRILQHNHFAVRQVLLEDLQSMTGSCVIASPL